MFSGGRRRKGEKRAEGQGEMLQEIRGRFPGTRKEAGAWKTHQAKAAGAQVLSTLAGS